MTLQQKHLERLQNEKIFVDVYTDHFEESTYGFIIDFNEEFLLLEQFTSVGEANGIGIFKRKNITRLRWEGNDIFTTEKFALKEKRIPNIFNLKIDTIHEALQSVYNKFGYVVLNIQNIDTGMTIIGEIEEMDIETIIIYEFGTYSTLDRKRLMMNIDEITKIEAGSNYENNLKEIYLKK
jgi:hypothetical protein